jgi:hypothetical protein
MVADTHLKLRSGTSFYLDLVSCSPGVAVHLKLSVLSLLYASDYCSVNMHTSTPSSSEAHMKTGSSNVATRTAALGQ